MLFFFIYYVRRNIADILAYFGYYNYPYKTIFLAGMPMSATTWVKNMCARIPGYFSRPMPMPYEIAIKQDIDDSAFNKNPKYGFSLYKTHLNPSKENLDCLRRNKINKIVVTYRDPRDVIISRYYRLLDFPKLKGEPHYADYKKMGKEKSISHSIEVVSIGYINWIRGWIDYQKNNENNCLLIKFEDLRLETISQFQKLLSFYEINLSKEQIDNIVNQSKGKKTVQENMKQAKLLPFGLASNFRKGEIGNWKMEMNQKQIKICKENFSSILMELDYEKNLNW